MTDCNTVPAMTNRNAATAPLLTREEAAEVLRVSVSTIDRYLRDGTIPRVRVGKRLVRIERADLDRILTVAASDGSALAEGGDAA